MCTCSIMSDSLQSHGLYAAYQAPLSMEFSRKEYGVHGHVLLQGIFPTQNSNMHGSPALAGRFFTTVPPGKPIS